MKALLSLLLAAQAGSPECANELTLRGVGASAAARIRPYADCINRQFVSRERILTACQGVRDNIARHQGSARAKARLKRALDWLDDMTRERANCETVLRVAR